MHLLQRLIRNRPYYWNTCGWTAFRQGARMYRTWAEAEGVRYRMTMAGIRVGAIKQ